MIKRLCFVPLVLGFISLIGQETFSQKNPNLSKYIGLSFNKKLIPPKWITLFDIQIPTISPDVNIDDKLSKENKSDKPKDYKMLSRNTFLGVLIFLNQPNDLFIKVKGTGIVKGYVEISVKNGNGYGKIYAYGNTLISYSEENISAEAQAFAAATTKGTNKKPGSKTIINFGKQKIKTYWSLLKNIPLVKKFSDYKTGRAAFSRKIYIFFRTKSTGDLTLYPKAKGDLAAKVSCRAIIYLSLYKPVPVVSKD